MYIMASLQAGLITMSTMQILHHCASETAFQPLKIFISCEAGTEQSFTGVLVTSCNPPVIHAPLSELLYNCMAQPHGSAAKELFH